MTLGERLRYYIYCGIVGGCMGGSVAGAIHSMYHIIWEFLTTSLIWAIMTTLAGLVLGAYLGKPRESSPKYIGLRRQIIGSLLGFVAFAFLLTPLWSPPKLEVTDQSSLYIEAIILFLYSLVSSSFMGILAGMIVAIALSPIKIHVIRKYYLHIVAGILCGMLLMTPQILFSSLNLGDIFFVAIGILGGLLGAQVGSNEYQQLTQNRGPASTWPTIP